jgi:hypothetical protein
VQHEFNNRIAAQREILRVVNQRPWRAEQLFGLSSKAINRWVAVNQIDQDSRLVSLVKEASEKLFFLANKSQEQISEEYIAIRAEIIAASNAIKVELKAL